MLNRMRIFADDIARLCEPGERPLFLGAAAYFSGHEDLGQEPPRFDAGTVVDMAFGFPTAYFMVLTDRVVTGTSLLGWPGCAALGLRDALEDMPDVLLTDRRLLLVQDLGQSGQRVTWARDRDAVAGLRRAGRLGQAGRVLVVLADGSAVAMMLGVLLPGRARRFVAAWTRTRH